MDGIHFILSLGIEYGYDEQTKLEPVKDNKETVLTHQFLMVYDAISLFDKDPNFQAYLTVFGEYLYLGQLLGFAHDEIEQAYLRKNEINHERQQQGY